MKHATTLSAIAGGLTLLWAVPGAAQTSMEPRKIIKIIREDIKPGHEVAHERIEAGYVRTLAKAKYPNYWGMTSMTGPSEAWFIEPYDSYAALGEARNAYISSPTIKAELDQLDARDGEVRSGGRTMIAVYQKELSLRPDQFRGRMPQMRFVSITTTRTRPGRGADFIKMRTMINEAVARAFPTATNLYYSVVSGAPQGTYVWIRAFASLKELDTEPGQKPVVEYMSDENRREYAKLTSEVVLSSEAMLFAISPAMSYVSQETTDTAPQFWKPKAAVAAKKIAGGGGQ